MSTINPETAKKFVNTVELPPVEAQAKLVGAPPIDFDEKKSQAMIVASEIMSFVKGVSVQRRDDITHASLLAQLVADYKTRKNNDVNKWYDAYFNALLNIGWVLHEKKLSEYHEYSNGAEAHNAIIGIATTLLGANTTAVKVITSILEGIKQKEASKPWITLFDRESKFVNESHFQISLCEQGEDDQFLISLMAFGLKAESTITQVLFFEMHEDTVDLSHYQGKVTVSDHVLSNIRDLVKQKLGDRASDFIAAVPDNLIPQK